MRAPGHALLDREGQLCDAAPRAEGLLPGATILVTFPDAPEAVTFGDTPEEALAQARDALLTIFDAFMKDRRDIPPSSPAAGTGVMLPALESTKIALYRAMRAGKVNKSQLAKRLDWHLPQVDRVLNVRHGSQLDQIEAALAAVGKRLVVDTADLEPVTLTVRSRSHAGAGRLSARERRHLAIHVMNDYHSQ